MENEPRQKWLSMLGQFGCYLLCLVYIAEKINRSSISAEDVFRTCRQKGYCTDDCFLGLVDGSASAHLILGMLTGGQWLYRKIDNATYAAGTDEYTVARWERKDATVGGVHIVSHFVVDSGSAMRVVEYDPEGDSLTVRSGKPVSLRVFRRVA